MPENDPSLNDLRTQASDPSEAPSLAGVARSLGDQSTQAEGRSSVSDLGALAANIDEQLELTDLTARYEIGEVIGRGGMGEVLLARDKRLERPVAIKRILGEGARSATALRRFLTEARSLAQLNHFNVVQVYDYGRDREGPFLILEYVAGKSLQDRLKDGPLPVEQAVDLTCQLCDGLGVAHKQGIIHRDVKPANVLLTEEGEPKLTDFGLAHRESGDDGRTQAGAVLGTIDFMPPEQRRDATQADARSDLWSLAATLYQMLTGRSPKVIRLDQVPEALRTVLGKALEEEPAERYPTTAEFKVALRDALRRGTVASGVLGEGTCPQCGTQNDPGRKFCRSCATPLSHGCLGCGEKIPVWEDVCGRCGTRQSVRLTELRGHCEQRLEQAASLGREYRFDEALKFCESVVQETQPALTDLRERGAVLTSELTARRDEQYRLRAAILTDAQAYWSASQYETVLKELEKIPESLCDAAVHELRSEARRRIVELTSLLTEIKRRVASKEHDGLESLTARVLEYQPNHSQVAELHRQLIERAEKRRQKYDGILAQAEQAYANQEDQRALAILGQLPGSERRDALYTAASQRLQRVQQLRELLGKMPTGTARIAPLRDYLELRPKDEDARRMLLELENTARGSYTPGRRSMTPLLGVGAVLVLAVAVGWVLSRSDEDKDVGVIPVVEAPPIRTVETTHRNSSPNIAEIPLQDAAKKTQTSVSPKATGGSAVTAASSTSSAMPISPSATVASATSSTTPQSLVNADKTAPDSLPADPSTIMKPAAASLQTETRPAATANAKNAEQLTAEPSSIKQNASDTNLNASVAFYFDEGTGGTVSDLSGALSAQLMNGTAWTQGRRSGAIQLDGIDDFLEFPNHDFGDRFSIVLWIKPTSTAFSCLLSNDDSGVHQGWGLHLSRPRTEDGCLGFRTGWGGDRKAVESVPGVIAINEWQMVTCSVNRVSATASLYLNGRLLTSDKLTRHFRTDGKWRLGTHVYSRIDWPFEGAVDDLQIFSRELTDKEVALIYEQQRISPQQSVAPVVSKPDAMPPSTGDAQSSTTSVAAVNSPTASKTVPPIANDQAVASNASDWRELTLARERLKWQMTPKASWTYKDGEIASRAGVATRYGYCFYTDQTFKNFDLAADVYLGNESNGGIFVRSRLPQATGIPVGYEIQAHSQSIDKNPTGSIFKTNSDGKASVQFLVRDVPPPANQWFHLRVIVVEETITVFVNDRRVAEYQDSGLPWKVGYLGLQAGKNGVVKYRNIRIREIK